MFYVFTHFRKQGSFFLCFFFDVDRVVFCVVFLVYTLEAPIMMRKIFIFVLLGLVTKDNTTLLGVKHGLRSDMMTDSNM